MPKDQAHQSGLAGSNVEFGSGMGFATPEKLLALGIGREEFLCRVDPSPTETPKFRTGSGGVFQT